VQGLRQWVRDPDGDPIDLSLYSLPHYGSLSFTETGAFQYAPNPGFSGNDRFQIQYSDGFSSRIRNIKVSVTTTLDDLDADGVSNDEEDDAADVLGLSGPIASENHTTAFFNPVDGRAIAVQLNELYALSNVRATLDPGPVGPPAEYSFPFGFVAFRVFTYPEFGQAHSAEVTLRLPEGALIDSYWKYGPEPGNETPHWYNFLWDGTESIRVPYSLMTTTTIPIRTDWYCV
jgi:hypothetical protein